MEAAILDFSEQTMFFPERVVCFKRRTRDSCLSFTFQRRMASECSPHYNDTAVDRIIRPEAVHRDRQCSVCLKVFSSPSARNRHLRDFHGDHSKEQRSIGALKECILNDGQANVCNGMTSQGLGLQSDNALTPNDHSRRKLPSGLVWGQCVICLKVFSSSSTLNRHRREIHGFHWEKKGSASKDVAPMDVAGHDQMERTTTMTTTTTSDAPSTFGVYDRQCPVCWKVFSSPSTLNRHRREIHGDYSEKEGNFRCSECPRSLSTRAAFLGHLETCHPNIAIHREELLFDSRGVFEEWKSRMEADTATEFLRRDGAKEGKDGIVTLYYKCHQSGGECRPSRGVSSSKSSSSPGTSRFFCPAHIVTRAAVGRGLSVTFFSTHMGHQFKSQRLKGSSPPVGGVPNRNRHDGTSFEDADNAAANSVMDCSQPVPSSSSSSSLHGNQRREQLSAILEGLFPVVEECTTADEFDAVERILGQVRPALVAIRLAATSNHFTQLFIKQEIVAGIIYEDNVSMSLRPVKRKSSDFDSTECGEVADAKVNTM